MAIDPDDERPFFAEDEGGPIKSFLEHLEDFRWTLVKSVSAIFIAVLICLVAGNRVVGVLMRPLQKAVVSYPATTKQVVTISFGTNRLGTFELSTNQQQELNLGTNYYASLDIVPLDILSGTNHVRVMGLRPNNAEYAQETGRHMQTSLVALGPAHAFLVGFRVAIYAGIAIASPFVFYFVGQFVLPAMRIREKKYLYKGLAFAVPLFICGVLFCYFLLMPAALAAAQLYANWFGFQSNFWDAGEYIDFICKFMLGMGLGFELPVVILLLVKIGILDYAMLKKARPYMVIINLVLGALLTTPEVFTQVLMAVPLQLLYEISVAVAWYWERRDKKRAAQQSAQDFPAD